MLSRRDAIESLIRDEPYFQLEDVEVAGVPWRVYRTAVRNMRAILESTADFGDRTFLVYQDQRWTYAEHLSVVAGLASRWFGEGVRKGDRVAIAMRNYPEWAMTFWAAQSLGAIAVPLNAWWTAGELAYALDDSRPKVLVADGERVQSLSDRLQELKIERVIAVRSSRLPPSGVLRWEDELAALEPEAELPDVNIDPDDDATIMYTSGTTGFPKGAIATQRNHATNLRNTELFGAAALKIAGTSPSSNPPQASMLQTFPFFHIGGLTGLYVATAFSAKLSLMYKWDTAEAADIVEREQVNAASMVPTLLRRLLEYAESHGCDFPALGSMATGGAPVPPDLIRDLEERFHRRVSPANGYGLTETTSAIIMNSGDEYFAHSDSVGRAVPGADLRVVMPNSGQRASTGSIGELWFRGPNVVRGYWNKPAETTFAFTDGWFHTGDLGYVDDEGLVYVVDRLKDVVIRAGENVYSAEVEAVLFDHPAVADVAIIGLPHPSWGEEVVAVVELQPWASVTRGELQQHAAERLAQFKVPTQVIFSTEQLPRTATGKVLKRELRQNLTESSPVKRRSTQSNR